MIITLSKRELSIAAQVGCARHIAAMFDRRPDAHGLSKADGWGLHVEGAAGEVAAAKALDHYWAPSVNSFKAEGDIGASIQVRTRSRHSYELIIRRDDRDDDTYVLVTGTAPRFHVRGSILGRHGKQDKWWQAHGDRPPAWFVPASALTPIEQQQMAA